MSSLCEADGNIQFVTLDQPNHRPPPPNPISQLVFALDRNRNERKLNLFSHFSYVEKYEFEKGIKSNTKFTLVITKGHFSNTT